MVLCQSKTSLLYFPHVNYQASNRRMWLVCIRGRGKANAGRWRSHVWIQVEALIVIAMNDSTIKLASVPAFTAQRGT